MRGHSIVAIAVTCAHIGCYSNDVVSPRGASAIRTARAEEGVVYTDAGEAIRIDPNSHVRFLRGDGRWTPWWSARDLLVGGEGVLIERDGGGYDGVRWADVEQVEIENFSGSKSLVATVAVSAAVIGLIAVVSASKGKIGDLGGVFVRTSAEVTVRAADAVVRSGDVRISGGASGAPPLDPSPAYEPPLAKDARPLFDGVTRRRSIARFGAALDAGSAFRGSHPFATAVLGTVRFFDYLELGGGLRFVSRGSGADRMYVGRLGMHAELDGHRRFAIPLLFDFGGGGGAARSTVRVSLGLRVRITEALWAGIFPLSPEYVGYGKSTPDTNSPTQGASGWTFPSSVEASFLF